MTWDFFVNYGMIAIKLVMAIGVAALFLKFFNMNNQLKQMTPLDIILNFLLSAILSNFILDSDVTLTDFAIIVAIYGVLLYILNKLTFGTDIGRRIFVGTPRVIIDNGKFDAKMMKRWNVNARDVAAAMRQQDIHSLRDVKTAQIEPNGNLTVIKRGMYKYPVILIDNGVVVDDGLQKINRDEKWLMRQLRRHRITDPDDVFIAQWDKNKIEIIKKD
ncbi:MAG: DUF421 domain-containing protein [Alphaproteobacteria bacterium]|nr:DUF421 domain-containing protein [Alphaproteobacteria bacterium]MDE6571247.1 DUF421 domain-containing protein [Alphaproteobacteria bacterium]